MYIDFNLLSVHQQLANSLFVIKGAFAITQKDLLPKQPTIFYTGEEARNREASGRWAKYITTFSEEDMRSRYKCAELHAQIRVMQEDIQQFRDRAEYLQLASGMPIQNAIKLFDLYHQYYDKEFENQLIDLAIDIDGAHIDLECKKHYQYREIGENSFTMVADQGTLQPYFNKNREWRDCTKAEYDRYSNLPEWDTRILETPILPIFGEAKYRDMLADLAMEQSITFRSLATIARYIDECLARTKDDVPMWLPQPYTPFSEAYDTGSALKRARLAYDDTSSDLLHFNAKALPVSLLHYCQTQLLTLELDIYRAIAGE